MIKVLDRDGVIVDSCAANLAAYSEASEKTGLGFDMVALEKSIHKGDSIEEFRERVWGKISDSSFRRLKSAKTACFPKFFSLIQVNPIWHQKIRISPKDFYIATKASIESSRFIIHALIPEFNTAHIFSTQNSQFESKVEILKKVSQLNNISMDGLIFYDDSIQTIRLAKEAGFQAELVEHFCGR